MISLIYIVEGQTNILAQTWKVEKCYSAWIRKVIVNEVPDSSQNVLNKFIFSLRNHCPFSLTELIFKDRWAMNSWSIFLFTDFSLERSSFPLHQLIDYHIRHWCSLSSLDNISVTYISFYWSLLFMNCGFFQSWFSSNMTFHVFLL